MRAWILEKALALEKSPLRLVELPDPEPGPDEICIEVSVCALCRTDIHICEGEIDLPILPIVPGHQPVGRVIKRGSNAHRFEVGDRVGLAWLHETCGGCDDCKRNDENLCRNATFTGYHVHGGYAEQVKAPEAFAYSLPAQMDDLHVSPLLCSGIIGYRAMRQADISVGETVGLFGFGSSAHIALQVARARSNRVFVITRGKKHRELARRMGADWVGQPGDTPPETLDRAVLFAPAGEVVVHALEAVRWGGTVASAAIYMSPIPQMDYTKSLFGEKTLRSTTASTRQDGEELMQAARDTNIETEIVEFPFLEANEGLLAIKRDAIQGSAVLRVAVAQLSTGALVHHLLHRPCKSQLDLLAALEQNEHIDPLPLLPARHLCAFGGNPRLDAEVLREHLAAFAVHQIALR
ncbi:MAG: zinc-dependent alcohol dehydrogenase family protein [Planctomycetota bacterium]